MMKRIILSHILVFFLLSSAAVDAKFHRRLVAPQPNFARLPKWDPSFTPVVVALGSSFLFVFFFSIYLRYCSDTDLVSVRDAAAGAGAHYFPSSSRQGIDPKLLDTFPILVYSTIKHLRIDSEALECAVCLTEFDHHDTLRLLPTCNHVFHPQCIDAWLGSHVTCPVCRRRLTPEHRRRGEKNDNDVVIAVPAEVDEQHELDESSASRIRTEVNSGERRSLRRSHSTGHSLSFVETVEKDMERYTLRLSEDVRRQILANHGGMRRSASYNVFRPEQPGEVKCQKF